MRALADALHLPAMAVDGAGNHGANDGIEAGAVAAAGQQPNGLVPAFRHASLPAAIDRAPLGRFIGAFWRRPAPPGPARRKGRTASGRSRRGGRFAIIRPSPAAAGPSPMDLDVEAIKVKIEKLKSEHRGLDQDILRLEEKPSGNPLDMQRLKRRKLALRDQITRLESNLLPDIIA